MFGSKGKKEKEEKKDKKDKKDKSEKDDKKEKESTPKGLASPDPKSPSQVGAELAQSPSRADDELRKREEEKKKQEADRKKEEEQRKLQEDKKKAESSLPTSSSSTSLNTNLNGTNSTSSATAANTASAAIASNSVSGNTSSPSTPLKPSSKSKDEKKSKRDANASSTSASSGQPQQLQQQQQQQQQQENVEAEIHSLEAAKLDPSESAATFQEWYNLFPEQVFVAYDKLQNFARDLNTQIPNPEVVLVGKRAHGKSSLIEAFLGQPLNAVGQTSNGAGYTKRPIYINLINNLQAFPTPKVTLKRDTLLKEFDRDVEVPLADLSAELAKRNKVSSDEPIVLQYEHKHVCNMTFIDTPPLLEASDESNADTTREEREALVLNLCRPSHRLLVAVETCRDWNKLELAHLVKKVDPELMRTTFVYSHFHTHLQSFTSTREVNKFFAGTLPDVHTFFTSLPTEGVRARYRGTDQFREKIFQAYRRDINNLEQLQFDKRYESNVGVHALQRYILSLAWKSYQESIPRILKQLRAKRVETEKSIKGLNQQLNSLDSSKLRSLASQYVVNFLQTIERLIAGTSEGNPAVNGQTLDEEKNAHGDGDWTDINHRVIRFEPEEWNIPYWDNKLYGGQQFERLLSEYRAVAEHTEMADITMDDVATAAGINKLNNIPNYAWAASDLAQQKSQDALVPLIEQLTSRAVFIFKRLANISEKVLEARKKKWVEDLNSHHHHRSNNNNESSVEDVERYTHFTYHVKDLFSTFVDKTSELCKEKAMDEFYSTRTIYWDLTSQYAENQQLPLERSDQEDTKSSVVDLSTRLFTKLRDRITKNVLLKFYNFFLVPMQNELWNEIQGKVNSLSDVSLEQIFEVNATKEKLKESIKAREAELARFAEQDKEFLQYASSFSKRGTDF